MAHNQMLELRGVRGLKEKRPDKPAWLEDTDSDSDDDGGFPEAAPHTASLEYPLIESALLRRYEICGQCGGTNRCVVYKAFERERRRFVALKVMVNAFGDAASAQRAYREVAYLQVLCGHPNVARLRSVYCAEGGRNAVVTLDFYHSDLRHAIVGGRLRPIHRTYVLRQLFMALTFMHSARIVHRDVRPSNIVVDDKCRAQLIDLSSAKFLGEAHDASATGALDKRRSPGLTDDVGCAFYRPCDALVGSKRAGGPEGDVWAAGCVAVEMETTVPLFAGASALDVLSLQLAVLGAPSSAELEAMGCGPPHPAPAAIAAAVALDAARRNVGLRDHVPRSTEQPTYIELIERAATRGAKYAALDLARANARIRRAGTEEVPINAEKQRDERLIEQVEHYRQDYVADIALQCTQPVPGARISAYDALNHPVFDAFKGTDAIREFDGDALHASLSLHAGNALDEGGARLKPSDYRTALKTYVKIFDARKIKFVRTGHFNRLSAREAERQRHARIHGDLTFENQSWGSSMESSVKSSAAGTYNSERGAGGDHAGHHDAPNPDDYSDTESD